MKTLLALTLVLAVAMPAAQAQTAAPAAASAASAPTLTVRAEVVAAMREAIELHGAGKAADALARIDKVLAELATPTPPEIAVLQRTRGLLALQLDRPAEAVRSLELALAQGLLQPADVVLAQDALARAQFALKNYPAALDWARKAIAGGSRSAALPNVVARSLYLSNDFAGAAQALEARLAAGEKLGENDVRILASSYAQAKDDAGYTRTLERLLREHPRPEYWPDLMARAQRQPGWQPRHDIDLYRLRLLVDAMEVADDYLLLADMTSRAGLPVEAEQVLEAGYAKGVLGKGPGAAEHQKMRASIARAASEDRQNLPANAARLGAVGDARSAAVALSTGAALVSIGQAERGLELMKAALAGPLADQDQGRLQLAIALHRAGRTPEALEQLRSVATHPTLGLLARLWTTALTRR